MSYNSKFQYKSLDPKVVDIYAASCLDSSYVLDGENRCSAGFDCEVGVEAAPVLYAKGVGDVLSRDGNPEDLYRGGREINSDQTKVKEILQ